MRKRFHNSIALLIALLMCFSGLCMITASAIGRIETRYYNYTGTGDINIRIDVYRLDENGNEQWVGGNDYDENEDDASIDFGKVLPGQTVSYITKITNFAESAWIRIEPEYLAENNIEWLTDDCLTIAAQGTNGNKGSWEKHDAYYYYTEPVATGDVVTYTTAFHVPSDLTDDTIPTKGFHIYLSADAVQTVHFTPSEADEDGKASGYKFSDDPWFGTVIEECYHHTDNEHYDNGLYTSGDTKDLTFSVKFEDFSAGFVEIGQDFFSNWARLMPGDEESGEVKVGNNYDMPVTIYFHIERVDEKSVFYDEELLRAVNIEIKSINEKAGTEISIYSGPLYGTTEPVALGRYTKDEDVTKLVYTVSFDKEYQNAYTLRDTETIWVFSTDIIYDMPAVGGAGTSWVMIGGAALTLMGAVLFIISIKRKGGVKA